MAEAKKKVNAIADYRAMDASKLNESLVALRKELVEQHRANKAGELPSTSVINKTRKSIAKVLTVQREQAAAKVQEEQEK